MPNWNALLAEINTEAQEAPLDRVRRKYLRLLSKKTNRNIISYYSGWLQRRVDNVEINDMDLNGIMTAVHGLDRSKGVDLILHTPGGEIAAAEQLVAYLKQMFGRDVRAIIPQIAMSAGTMIGCSCKSIVMGKQSCLGPIDPRFKGVSARGVIEEFNEAIKSCKTNPSLIPMWQVIISKYHPTFIAQCRAASSRAVTVVTDWLKDNMFHSDPNRSEKARIIVENFTNLGHNIGHDRHITKDEAIQSGLVIESLEDDQEFQDLVLTVHHSYMHSFSNSPATKAIENQNGVAMFLMHQQPPRPA